MKHPNKIIMIYHQLSLGGIETLIVRTANHFSSLGISITIFARSGELEAELSPAIKIVKFDRYREIWSSELKDCGKTLILAFDPLTFMVAKKLQRAIQKKIGRKSKLHAGIFHPRTLGWPGDPRPVRWLNQTIFKLAQKDEFYFMSDAVKISSEKILGATAINRIVRIPMKYSVSAKIQVKESKSRLNIISVGRLVEFKSYNRHIPRIVANLLSKGVDVCWSVWGDGDDRDYIEGLIKHYKVDGSVILMGELPYSKFSSEVSASDLFIGMGTAALEAAGMGVPTICCVDQMEDSCYGFLHEAPQDTIGEQVSEFSYRHIESEITNFLMLNQAERFFIGEQCKNAALVRSGSASFDDLLEAPLGPTRSVAENLIDLLATPYLLAVDSRKTRFLFRALRRKLM